MPVKSTLRNVLTLTVIAVVSVFLLSLVYQITKGPIEKAAAEKQAQAYRTMYASDVELTAIEGLADRLSVFNGTLEGEHGGAYAIDAMRASKDGQTIGYAVTVVSPKGYGGDIRLALRIDIVDKTAVINGLRTLEQSETAGFGSVCADASYQEQYTDAAATEAVVIAGATFTTDALDDAIGAARTLASLLSEETGKDGSQ